MAGPSHPLLNPSEREITRATSIVKDIARSEGIQQELWFKSVALHEPPKAALLPYLDQEAAGVPASKRTFIPRCIEVVWSYAHERKVNASIINLDSGAEVGRSSPPNGHQGPNDRNEVKKASETLLQDPMVVEAIKKLNLPEGTVVQCDPWMSSADSTSSVDTPKQLQPLLYARAPGNHAESNQYAFPLPFSPRFDVFQQKVVSIDPLATGGTEDGLAYHTAKSQNPLEHCAPGEYYADLLEGPLRTDIKPLHIHQPEGPSFTITEENCVSWQKWRFRVGFNYREGMTLHDVRYDGRPLFYRLSVSEMTVPYGDPRAPFHRKQAFDLGDAGAGSTATTLSLGCDCLGEIYYFSEWLNEGDGSATKQDNVICLHEVDAGIGWKQVNVRTGQAAVARARNLVLQTSFQVGNYNYILSWVLNQAGGIDLETRATGILSTHLIDAGKTSEWGTVVAPGVLAQNHQHLFSLRIDPMIDGPRNTVVQEDTVPVAPSARENPHGNAFRAERTPFERSGAADAAPLRNRCFKILNEGRRNRVSGNFVGYKLVPNPCQLILADAGSVARRRAQFAGHHVWVTGYRDGELWAGGKWTNQSLSEAGGVADMAARRDGVRDADVVLWHTYGMTHLPRVEDFPVMPVELTTVSLRPVNFFERNPALDVPQSRPDAHKTGSPMTGTEVKLGSGRGASKL